MNTGAARMVSVSHGSGLGDTFKVIESWDGTIDGHKFIEDGHKF